MSQQSYQPRRGRGSGYRGNRGKRGKRGGYNYRGRGRRGGQMTAAWKMLEQYPGDKPIVVCKLKEDQFVATSNGYGYVYVGSSIKHDQWETLQAAQEQPLLYNVKTNKWIQFNMPSNQYRFIGVIYTYVNTQSDEMYIVASYVDGRDYESLQSNHQQYEQYKTEQTGQLETELEQKVQQTMQTIKTQYEQEISETVMQSNEAFWRSHFANHPSPEEKVRQTMQQTLEDYQRRLSTEGLKQEEDHYRSAYRRDMNFSGRLYQTLSQFEHHSIVTKCGMFIFDTNENTLELLDTLAQEDVEDMAKLGRNCNIYFDTEGGVYFKLFTIDGVLYKFMYGMSTKLMKWDANEKQFTLQHEYKQLPTTWPYTAFCEHHNIMLLIHRLSRTNSAVYTLDLKNNIMDKVTVNMKLNEHGQIMRVAGYGNCVIIVEWPGQQHGGGIWTYNIQQKQIRKSRIKLSASGEIMILNNTMHIVNTNNHFAMEMSHIIPPYWLNQTAPGNQNKLNNASKEKGNRDISRRTELSEVQTLRMKLSNMENTMDKMNSTLRSLTSAVKSMEKKQKQDKYELIALINSSKNSDDVKEEDPKNKVKDWLKGFGLEQYDLCFVSNGYESLDFIAGIESKQDLFEIGIELKGHQTQMMIQINKLKQRNQEVE
eukprot:746876_1